MDDSTDIPVTPESWNEKAVFLKALSIPASEREAFLKDSCPDAERRQRIRSLLQNHDAAPDDLLKIDVKLQEGPEKHPAQFGEFKILSRLGQGGMGEVFLAEDTILGRHVALKVLAGHLIGSERALGRFRDEARNAAALKHPAIVPVFKLGQEGDDWYLVTEYVDGVTLEQVIAERREKRESADTQSVRAWHRQLAEYGATIAEALDCAHRAGIIHRDVKPSNILIDRNHGPRLADFGIAMQIEAGDRTQTAMIGTCYYMSPEQADLLAKRIDQRSDIFSLGVVLYELLALRRPFDGVTPSHVLRAIVESTPERLRSIDRRIPIDLETICQKAIEKQPKDRYPTAAHVAADLRSYLNGEPILARPPSRLRRLARRMHRHRGPVAAVAMTAVIAIAIGAFWFAAVQRRNRLCNLRVTGDEKDVMVRVARVTGSSLESVEEAGATGLPCDLLLSPGLYRLTGISPEGGFSEASAFLVQGRTAPALLMPPTQLPGDVGDMVRFEGGDIVVKTIYSAGGSGQETVHIEPFFIDRTEVSNREYKRFLEATHYPAPYHWVQLGYPTGLDERPVVGVSWEDANAFCRFVGKRLPTAAEWEFAMRWPDDRFLPWKDGDPVELPQITIEAIERMTVSDLKMTRAEYEQHTQDVASSPSLRSAAGLYHGATNVAELTETIVYGESTQVIQKGASWVNSPKYHDLTEVRTTAFATRDDQGKWRTAWSMKVGFRCARSAQPQGD